MKTSAMNVLGTQSPAPLQSLLQSAQELILGKEHELTLALAAILAKGHILIEDLPGMGKTSFVMTLAHLLGLPMTRIQFTNDLLPGDILGANIFDPQTRRFQFHPGPIFSEVVLGDELNRANPKTQSAFLQAMEEKSISLDGVTHPLPNPFFLIATQNPMDQAGTYPLPESQIDRFMMRIRLGYPTRQMETRILKQGDTRHRLTDYEPALNRDLLLQFQQEADQVYAADPIYDYIVHILEASRTLNHRGGLSPRAGLLLIAAAKCWAFLHGRNVCLPDDVKAVADSVLAHRLKGGSEAVAKLLEHVAVP